MLNVRISVDVTPETPKNEAVRLRILNLLTERLAEILPAEHAAELRRKFAEAAGGKPA